MCLTWTLLNTLRLIDFITYLVPQILNRQITNLRKINNWNIRNYTNLSVVEYYGALYGLVDNLNTYI